MLLSRVVRFRLGYATEVGTPAPRAAPDRTAAADRLPANDTIYPGCRGNIRRFAATPFPNSCCTKATKYPAAVIKGKDIPNGSDETGLQPQTCRPHAAAALRDFVAHRRQAAAS
jgi:hypothetical protein